MDFSLDLRRVMGWTACSVVGVVVFSLVIVFSSWCHLQVASDYDHLIQRDAYVNRFVRSCITSDTVGEKRCTKNREIGLEVMENVD